MSQGLWRGWSEVMACWYSNALRWDDFKMVPSPTRKRQCHIDLHPSPAHPQDGPELGNLAPSNYFKIQL
jgi:hypothetical protein